MITKEEAIKIAEEHHGPGFKFFQISHGLPSNCSVYRSSSTSWTPDDAWCVLCSAHPEKSGMILSSSRAIVIHKDTGAILYDGSANDEG